MDAKQLNKLIDDTNARAKGLGEEYQKVGLLVLEHVNDTGDVGPANRLYLGMPKSVRGLAMGNWLVKYGKLQVSKDRNTMQSMPLVFNKAKDTDMEGAKAKPWYTMVPEKHITEVFDLQVAVKRLLQQAKDKKIQIGGKAMHHEAEVALRTMCVLVGLQVDAFHVDEKTGKMEADGAVQAPKAEETPKEETPAEPQVDPAIAAAAAAQAEAQAKAAAEGMKAAVDKAAKAKRETATAKGSADKPRNKANAKAHGRAEAAA